MLQETFPAAISETCLGRTCGTPAPAAHAQPPFLCCFQHHQHKVSPAVITGKPQVHSLNRNAATLLYQNGGVPQDPAPSWGHGGLQVMQLFPCPDSPDKLHATSGIRYQTLKQSVLHWRNAFSIFVYGLFSCFL